MELLDMFNLKLLDMFNLKSLDMFNWDYWTCLICSSKRGDDKGGDRNSINHIKKIRIQAFASYP